MTARRAALAVLALAGAGLALRIWFLLDVTGDSSMVGDGLEYLGLADGIADGRGYVSPFTPPGVEAPPSAHKPPLYPLLLSFVSLLGGSGHVPFQVASALVGTATVVVCAVLAGRIAGPRAAVLAAAIGAAYPVFLVADASLRAESLYGLCVALTLLAAYAAWRRPAAGRLVLLGGLIGLSTLARSEGLLLLLLLAVPIAWGRAPPGRAGRVALVTGACVLVLAPWLARCWIVFDQPVLISTNSGDLIAGANCDQVYSGPHLGAWSFACATSGGGGNEAEVASELRRRGFDYAADHAGRLPVVMAARGLRTWGFYDPAGEVAAKTLGEGRSRTANWLGLVFCWALLALAVAAFAVLRRRGEPVFILAAPFAVVVFVSVTTYGILRFRDARRRGAGGAGRDRRGRGAGAPRSGAAVGRLGHELSVRSGVGGLRGGLAARGVHLRAHVAARVQQLADGGDQHLRDRELRAGAVGPGHAHLGDAVAEAPREREHLRVEDPAGQPLAREDGLGGGAAPELEAAVDVLGGLAHQQARQGDEGPADQAPPQRLLAVDLGAARHARAGDHVGVLHRLEHLRAATPATCRSRRRRAAAAHRRRRASRAARRSPCRG